MTDENLGDVLNNNMLAYMKGKALEQFSERLHLTLGQLVKLCEHPEQGKVISNITLQDIVDHAITTAQEGLGGPLTDGQIDEPEEEVEKTAKKASTKKKAKKAAKKKSAAKKKASSKKEPKKASGKKEKADKGKPKPRLDYDRGMKEMLAALKAAGGPCGRKTLESATGYTGVQIRAFAKKLEEKGKIEITGSGRNTRYQRS